MIDDSLPLDEPPRQRLKSLAALAADAVQQPIGRRPCGRWGINELDEWIGLNEGVVCVVGGAPGSGKTSAVTQVAMASAEAMGHPPGGIIICSLEVPGKRLGALFLRRLAGVDRRAVESGELDEIDRGECERVIEELSEQDSICVLAEDESPSVDNLEGLIREHKRDHDFRLLIVDNYQLCSDASSSGEIEKAQHIARGMRRLANRHGICVVGIAHLSKEGVKALGKEDAMAAQWMFEGAQAVAQSATAMVILHKVGDRTRFSVVKNNYGESDCHIDLLFDRNSQTFASEVRAQHRPRPIRNDNPFGIGEEF